MQTTWDVNGDKLEEGPYVDGLAHGSFKTWVDGELRTESGFRGGPMRARWMLCLVLLTGVGCGGEPVDPDPDVDGDGFPASVDCDDADASVYPRAEDAWYDGVDSDCQGDDDFDQDEDGVLLDEDCDDENPDVQPGAAEVCNGVDDNCDGRIDPATAEDATDYFRDDDGDGYGSTSRRRGCERPDGYVTREGDCDDQDPSVHQGANEVACDGVDNDCSTRSVPPGGARLGEQRVASVQEALEAASPGDTIELCEGEHDDFRV